MKGVSHQQACQLLHNKFVVVLGDSIQRSVYKDLIMLLQSDQYLSQQQLKTKGERSFQQDSLVEGGCLSRMHNGTAYKEVRQFQSPHHLVRFYFVTRVFSAYMQSILKDIRNGLKPDIVVVNSCVWDISRYDSSWILDYKENLHRFFDELKQILPDETLVIWSLTMPLAERIKGGFLVPEIEHKAPQLRYDVIEANFYSGTLADSYGMDVLDLHFQFRFSLQHRTKDGVHWNALAHRRITSLLLQHAARAWGVIMPPPLTSVEDTEVSDKKPVQEKAPKPAAKRSNERRPKRRHYNNHREVYLHSFPEEVHPWLPPYHYRTAGAYRPALPPPPVHRHKYNYGDGFYPRHFHPSEHYNDHHHQNVMRSRHTRHHYAPYTRYRPNQY